MSTCIQHWKIGQIWTCRRKDPKLIPKGIVTKRVRRKAAMWFLRFSLALRMIPWNPTESRISSSHRKPRGSPWEIHVSDGISFDPIGIPWGPVRHIMGDSMVAGLRHVMAIPTEDRLSMGLPTGCVPWDWLPTGCPKSHRMALAYATSYGNSHSKGIVRELPR